jgi:hypothetical protein
MGTTENSSERDQSIRVPSSSSMRIKLKHSWFILSGAISSSLWLTLFVAGLLVDSAYYRVAINYGFADLRDWIWAVIAFTVSNVAILAFFAGLLGGIISKLRATEGFTKDEVSLKLTKKDISFQIENPFVSAVRGMFVFVAILFVQYVSSFNDLGSINKDTGQAKANTEINYDQFYSKLKQQIKDSAEIKGMEKVWKEQVTLIDKNSTDAGLVNQIFILRDSLRYLRSTYDPANDQIIRKLDTDIKALRRKLKPPEGVDFSNIGISSFSYFKFAIIVSFLAFIFGYDASGFATFIGKLPIISDSSKKKDNKEESVKLV